MVFQALILSLLISGKGDQFYGYKPVVANAIHVEQDGHFRMLVNSKWSCKYRKEVFLENFSVRPGKNQQKAFCFSVIFAHAADRRVY